MEEYDWILIKKNRRMDFSFVDNVAVFEDSPVNEAAIFPSNHYGVSVDIDIESTNKNFK
ncbi:hypothetical protein [Bacillus clarus]|uniref:Uncharacterized protein n=1 Tax=Bacillus clarus TaxID=2338372 RepID=A0A090YZV1_9BACI|nr:hypothetical protein [Bacillus clarus]KFN03460.1 hypothetical protein DJ93_4634 [Bacillus clarus]